MPMLRLLQLWLISALFAFTAGGQGAYAQGKKKPFQAFREMAGEEAQSEATNGEQTQTKVNMAAGTSLCLCLFVGVYM